MNNGSDGATSAMWGHGGAAAGERGYHWMTFDGPGQQYALYEQGIPFRHDWEAVLTPVVDAMLARADVDATGSRSIGISQGGFWVPRALAFEHRLAAAVADGGVVDISRSVACAAPGRAARAARDRPERRLRRNLRGNEQARTRRPPRALEFRGRPYGITSGSRYDLYESVSAYRLGDEVNDITTPMLICDPDDDQFLPGQPQELYDRLPGEKKLVALHRRGGRGSSLRADGLRCPRCTHLRLARRLPRRGGTMNSNTDPPRTRPLGSRCARCCSASACGSCRWRSAPSSSRSSRRSTSAP